MRGKCNILMSQKKSPLKCLKKMFIPKTSNVLCRKIWIFQDCPRHFRYLHDIKFSQTLKQYIKIFLGNLVSHKVVTLNTCANDGKMDRVLRIWWYLSLLNLIWALILSVLLKLPPRKLELWLLCVSMNLPLGLAWNT